MLRAMYLAGDQDPTQTGTDPSIQELLRVQGEAIRRQGEVLDRIQQAARDELLWRKVATAATVAGALFAAARLSEIYFAVKRRRGG